MDNEKHQNNSLLSIDFATFCNNVWTYDFSTKSRGIWAEEGKIQK